MLYHNSVGTKRKKIDIILTLVVSFNDEKQTTRLLIASVYLGELLLGNVMPSRTQLMKALGPKTLK